MLALVRTSPQSHLGQASSGQSSSGQAFYKISQTTARTKYNKSVEWIIRKPIPSQAVQFYYFYTSNFIQCHFTHSSNDFVPIIKYVAAAWYENNFLRILI